MKLLSIFYEIVYINVFFYFYNYRYRVLGKLISLFSMISDVII